MEYMCDKNPKIYILQEKFIVSVYSTVSEKKQSN